MPTPTRKPNPMTPPTTAQGDEIEGLRAEDAETAARAFCAQHGINPNIVVDEWNRLLAELASLRESLAKAEGIVAFMKAAYESLKSSADLNFERWGKAEARALFAESQVAEAKGALGRLMLAYVNTLELGRDRIVFLGGQCDPVDVMEAGDPALRAARSTLANLEKETDTCALSNADHERKE